MKYFFRVETIHHIATNEMSESQKETRFKLPQLFAKSFFNFGTHTKICFDHKQITMKVAEN